MLKRRGGDVPRRSVFRPMTPLLARYFFDFMRAECTVYVDSQQFSNGRDDMLSFHDAANSVLIRFRSRLKIKASRRS